MRAFSKIYNGLDVRAVTTELKANSHLFGANNTRKYAGPVHAQMDDIWLRYGDIQKMVEKDENSSIADEHDSVWLNDLPECRKLCFKVMSLVDGERLGGVLITKLPPKGEILTHTDSGWHAEYYDKYYIPIENEVGAVFNFGDDYIAPDIGDVWAFDNSIPHSVKNNSTIDRIAMVVCIRQSKYSKSGELLIKG